MDSKILKPERYKLYVPMDWKKKSLFEILKHKNIIDFNSSDTMTFNYLEKYKLKNKINNERHFANNTDAILSLIENGFGYSVLSEEFARTSLKNKRIHDISPKQFFDFKLTLAWYYRTEMPAYFKKIIESIQ